MQVCAAARENGLGGLLSLVGIQAPRWPQPATAGWLASKGCNGVLSSAWKVLLGSKTSHPRGE